MASENRHNTDFDQLYKKYLLEECSEEERAILLELLLDADAEEHWNLEEVVNLSAADISLSAGKTASIYQQITGEAFEKKPSIFKLNRRVAAVAALLVAVLCGGMYIWKSANQKNNPFQELSSISNNTKFVKSILLSDGSKVLLKQGARLALLSDFNQDTVRRVKLEGEAFFEVAKNPNKAFCVLESGTFDVRVLGTAFNLINLPAQNNLVLKHGKVQVSHGDKKMYVAPGEGVQYDAKKHDFEKSLVDTAASNLWTYSFLSFEKEPLLQIFEDLNSLYPEAHLVLHESNKSQIFTGYLPANDLEKSIEILNKAFNKLIISKR